MQKWADKSKEDTLLGKKTNKIKSTLYPSIMEQYSIYKR